MFTVRIVHSVGSVEWRSQCKSSIHYSYWSRTKRILKGALPGFFGKVVHTTTLNIGLKSLVCTLKLVYFACSVLDLVEEGMSVTGNLH